MYLPSLEPPIIERQYWKALIVAVLVAVLIAITTLLIATRDDHGSCACPEAPAVTSPHD